LVDTNFGLLKESTTSLQELEGNGWRW
jgi:hypothetical protein